MEIDKDKKINSESQANQSKSEMQQKIDKDLQSDELRDMHLESGEKINEYEI